jgi:curved DNA-binding protein CbpA
MSSAPTAEGNFTRTPLVHLLVYMLDQRRTGTTAFTEPSGAKHSIYFQGGIPAKIQTGTMIAPFDRVILEMGLLDEATVRATLLEVSKQKVLFGRLLVSKGLLDESAIRRVLTAQLAQKVGALFELPSDTTYAYYDGENQIANYGGPELTPCEPLAVIMAGVRVRARDPIVDATLERLAARPLGLHIDADPRSFDLQPREAAVVDVLRTKRLTLAELIAAGVADERVVRSTIYALAITRHLDLGAGKGPIGLTKVRSSSLPPGPDKEAARETAARMLRQVAPGSPASHKAVSSVPPRAPEEAPQAQGRVRTGAHKAIEVPPQPATTGAGRVRTGAHKAIEIPSPATAAASTPTGGDVSSRRVEIRERHENIEKATHFEILGVTEDAAPDKIQAAYFALAKAWHPDRLPPELVDLKPQVSKVFAKMSDAFQTLNDAEKRAEYVQKLSEGIPADAEQEKVARAVDAALDFQKAEVMLKKHDVNGAESLARRAAAADPDQPEYVALLVWIQSMRRGDPPALAEGARTAHYDDLIKTLDSVLSKEPRYERALFYRGMLLKRSGYPEKAIRDFRLAAEINPKNLDAVREVRLFEMRNKKGPDSNPPSSKANTKNEGGGLFGRLFKK